MTEHDGMPKKAPKTAPQDLRNLICGFFISRAVYVAAYLNLADRLADAPQDAAGLAAQVNVHGPTLYRVLRVLAAAGVFFENDDGRFSNTELSSLLRQEVPGSLHALALMFGDKTSWLPWEDLMYSVKTSSSAFEHVFGMPYFDYLSQHPADAQLFDKAMISSSSMVNNAIVAAYDFSSIKVLVDIAGGRGATLAHILNANPHLRGMLFDLPHVTTAAKEYLGSMGVSDRCEVVAGNFFESVPSGSDAYFMKHILHDWGDEQCHLLLQRCHAAMGKNGKLLIVEKIIPPGNEPFDGKLLDLHMLIMTHGGRERTKLEYQQLFEASGFRVSRVVDTNSPWSVLEAVKA